MMFTTFCCVFICGLILENVAGIHVSNLNDSCLRCLCHVAGCDLSHGCSGGYCGPFYISRLYWIDAGRPTLPEDNPERREERQFDGKWRAELSVLTLGSRISSAYPAMSEIQREAEAAYEDCAREYYCARRVVENYMAKFGKDCNEDGVTDCYDYMMINHHGASCSEPLHFTPLGRRRLQLYKECRLGQT